jgi:hypothetical protein
MWGESGEITTRTSAPGTTRTRNPLIRSQMLYPLSYGGISCDRLCPVVPIIPQMISWEEEIYTRMIINQR